MNLHVGGQIIRVTPEHPFWVEGRGWVAAAFLRIGDMLRTSDDRSMMVEGVASSGQVSTVYNFHVVDYRTYYVGDQAWGFDVWTHNAAHSNGGGEGATPPGESVPREGIYEFPDASADGTPYFGQSGSIPERLQRHIASGRLSPGTPATTTEVLGGRIAREIAEHRRIQELTDGTPARLSPQVSNQRDPIGPARQHLLDELFGDQL